MEHGGWADYMTMHKIYIRLAEADKKAANNAVFEFFKTRGEKVLAEDENANVNANKPEKTA